MALVKRAIPAKREQIILCMDTETESILIEKTARAISDWHSERDWPLHIDSAKRAVEAIAELLQREGHRDAADYLRVNVWSDPSMRKTAG